MDRKARALEGDTTWLDRRGAAPRGALQWHWHRPHQVVRHGCRRHVAGAAWTRQPCSMKGRRTAGGWV